MPKKTSTVEPGNDFDGRDGCLEDYDAPDGGNWAAGDYCWLHRRPDAPGNPCRGCELMDRQREAFKDEMDR